MYGANAMKISYIVPAGGSGNRFGSEIPKQFIKLDGIPIIIRTLKRLQSHHLTARIIVPIHTEWKDHFEKLLLQWDVDGIEITGGGDSRHASILSALGVLAESDSYIAIHDAVRPLVSNDLLDRLADNLALSGSAIPLLPVTDTIKMVDSDEGVIMKTVDRSQLRAAQTPQMFRIEDYKKAVSASLSFPTDDSSILEQAGYNPSYVRGEERNIKITTPHDMLLAELLINTERESAH